MSKELTLSIISVGQVQDVPTERGGYRTLEVAFKDLEKGKVDGKKLVDFTNKELFKKATELTPGQVVKVMIEKEAGRDGKEYWQWKSIEVVDGEGASVPSAPVPSTATKPAVRVTGSNYETADERATRQVFIIRQSSVSSALKFYEQTNADVSLEDVIQTAERIKEYVINGISGGSSAQDAAKESDSKALGNLGKTGGSRKANQAQAKTQKETIDNIDDDIPF